MTRTDASTTMKHYSAWSVQLTTTDVALWGFVAVGFVFDIVLTYYGVGMGLQESNPIARTLFELIGVVESLVLLKTLGLLRALSTWASVPDRFRAVVPLGIGIPWVVASVINASLILQL